MSNESKDTADQCDCPSGSYGKKHSSTCYENRISVVVLQLQDIRYLKERSDARIAELELENKHLHEANAIVTKERNEALAHLRALLSGEESEPLTTMDLLPLDEHLAQVDRVAAELRAELCEGCPPVGYPTNETRCAECTRNETPDVLSCAPGAKPTEGCPVEIRTWVRCGKPVGLNGVCEACTKAHDDMLAHGELPVFTPSEPTNDDRYREALHSIHSAYLNNASAATLCGIAENALETIGKAQKER